MEYLDPTEVLLQKQNEITKGLNQPISHTGKRFVFVVVLLLCLFLLLLLSYFQNGGGCCNIVIGFREAFVVSFFHFQEIIVSIHIQSFVCGEEKSFTPYFCQSVKLNWQNRKKLQGQLYRRDDDSQLIAWMLNQVLTVMPNMLIQAYCFYQVLMLRSRFSFWLQ